MAHQKKVSEILDEVFKNTKYRYYIDNQEVFLTKGKILNFNLPYDYFSKNTNPDTSLNIIENDTLYAIWENKLYEIGDKTIKSNKKSFQISGFVKDANTNEPMIGASVF